MLEVAPAKAGGSLMLKMHCFFKITEYPDFHNNKKVEHLV